MDTRQAYKQKYAAQIEEWGAKIDVIKARARMAKAQATIDLAPHVDGVHDKYEAAKAKIARMAEATDDKWHEVMKDADEAWQDLERSVEGALAAIKPHAEADPPTKTS